MAIPVPTAAAGSTPDTAGKKSAAPVGGAAAISATRFATLMRPMLEKTTPLFALLSQTIATIEPYVIALVAYFNHLATILKPYHPEEFLPAMCGFVLVFFGGNFFTLCAAVEAYRLIGFDDTKIALKKLKHSYDVAMAASKKDDEVDADGDGVADVKQIDARALAVRKAAVVAKAVDPDLVTDALVAINGGLMAVVATLRVRFAACVTIGSTVGEMAHNAVQTHAEPALLELTPSEYKKWVPCGLRYGCQLCGFVIAWFLQMSISAFHSATRGAQMFARGSLTYATRRGYLNPTAIDEKGRVFNACVFALAFVGFWSQFWSGYSLPFPLNILLLPVTFAEYAMRFVVFMLG